MALSRTSYVIRGSALLFRGNANWRSRPLGVCYEVGIACILIRHIDPFHWLTRRPVYVIAKQAILRPESTPILQIK